MKNGLDDQINDLETSVTEVVRAFYAAFDRGFTGECDFADEDWNHTNPFGGRARGREAALREVREVHTNFLKGVTDTIETRDVRFAIPGVAVATVTSRMGPYTTPDGDNHVNERHIRTFVVVERPCGWRVLQDQNTMIGG